MAENYGIKVAKQGHDISESDRNMVFTSKRVSTRVAKIVTVEYTTAPANVADIVVEITHGLGYTPQFFVLLSDELAPKSYVEFSLMAYSTPTKCYAKFHYNPGYVPTYEWSTSATFILLKDKIK